MLWVLCFECIHNRFHLWKSAQVLLLITDIHLNLGFHPIPLFPCYAGYADGFLIRMGVSVPVEFVSHKCDKLASCFSGQYGSTVHLCRVHYFRNCWLSTSNYYYERQYFQSQWGKFWNLFFSQLKYSRKQSDVLKFFWYLYSQYHL